MRTPVLSTLHLDRRASVTFKRRIVHRRVDAAHDASLADADAHFAFDHKSEAAEHAFLLDAAARS